MNEVVLTDAEEIVEVRGVDVLDYPAVTLSKHHVYFNRLFAEQFSARRVRISKSGPYVVFRPGTGTTNTYAVTYLKGEKGRGARTGTPLLMQVINPSKVTKSYPVVPAKGGGWCIKIF